MLAFDPHAVLGVELAEDPDLKETSNDIMARSRHNTVTIRIPDMSGIRMVDLGSVFEWPGF